MQSPLRWNGGKRDRIQVYARLLQGFPSHQYHYLEPCLGGGSVYYALGQQFKARSIGDLNGGLINFYRVLQNNCDDLLTELQSGEYWYHGFQTASKLNYHRIRGWNPTDPIQRAARFLFLNQCSINGLMRVNKQGQYNAGPGDTKPRISPRNLRECSAALQGARIFRANALEVVEQLGKLPHRICRIIDPPYHDPDPKRYTRFVEQFTEADQIRLARALLSSRHAFIYTNKATPLTVQLFEGVDQFRHPLRHKVGPRECRTHAEEELWVYRLG
jgi:DNA adenine methylase